MLEWYFEVGGMWGGQFGLSWALEDTLLRLSVLVGHGRVEVHRGSEDAA